MFKKGFLKEKPKLSLIVLLFFILAFTTTGVYIIYRSLASDTYDIVDGVFALPSGKEVIRVWGPDRYITSVGMSQKVFADGAAKCAVLVNGEDWPDATVAGSLAGSCGAPILLSQKSSIPTATINEIKRLQPSKIYLIGGTAVLYPAVETAAASLVPGATVKRISGATRYETAVSVANEVAYLNGGKIPDNTIFVATGQNYPDALTIGSVAALKKYPIIFADTSLGTSARSFISQKGITKSIVIGGTLAVTPTVYSQLPGAVRITGIDRYQTSYNFALYAIKYISGVSATNIGIASGENYPDALAAGPFLAKTNNSILILDGYLTKGYVSKLLGAFRSTIGKVYIIGGAAAISDSNYLTYANNLGADYTYSQVKTQALVDIYVKSCPILAGTTVDYGDSHGYRAVAFPKSAHIVISPLGPDSNHPLSTIVWHEIHHIYDYRDGDTNRYVSYLGMPVMDWAENIPPYGGSPACITAAAKSIGTVISY